MAKRLSVPTKHRGARRKTKYNQVEITVGDSEEMTFPAPLTKQANCYTLQMNAVPRMLTAFASTAQLHSHPTEL